MYDLPGTDQEMLAGLAEGRRDVAEMIYRRHYPLVVNWIGMNGGAEADAADGVVSKGSLFFLF